MDIQLYCEEHGQGFPLILLHGNGEDLTYFSSQISFFQDKFHVIALDTRGHGRSPRGTAPFTISQFADDLFDFLQEKNIHSAHILGFSDGGNIALTFALRHPAYVDHLIVDGANLYPKGLKWSVRAPMVLEYPFSCILPGKRIRKHRDLLALMVKEPRLSPDGLSGLCVPTLVLAGDRDVIQEKHTRLIAACLPLGKLRILPGSHYVARENPDIFNRTVLEFLSADQAAP